MPPPIEVRNLFHFIKLAEHSSFSAAADTLGLAQPSLTYSIAKLEAQLGVKLAIRSPRGFELTAAGIALAREGSLLLESLGELVERIRDIGEAEQEIRVGLPPTLCGMLAVPLAESVHIELPGIRLHIAQGMSDYLLELIHRGVVDIGCVYEKANPTEFVSYPLLTEELFLVTAPDNWHGEVDESGAFRPIALDQLEGLPLVLPGNTHGDRVPLIASEMQRLGVRPNIVTRVDSLPPIIELVERASAYSLLPRVAVMQQLAAGRIVLVPIRDQAMTRTAYVVRRRPDTISSARSAIIRILFSVAAEAIRRFELPVRFHPLTDERFLR